MDFTGCCEKAERILTGAFPIDQLNTTTAWIIQHLTYIVGSKEAIKGTITEEEFIGKNLSMG
jgi:hypothetical protein